MKNKDQFVAVRVDEEMKSKLQVLADKADRKLSDFIRIELKKLVDKIK